MSKVNDDGHPSPIEKGSLHLSGLRVNNSIRLQTEPSVLISSSEIVTNAMKDTVLTREPLVPVPATEVIEEKIRKRFFVLPAWLDMTEKVLRNIALTFMAASIVQMFRSGIFVYCALFAVWFL